MTRFLLLAGFIFFALGITGCAAYDTPEYVTIEPSQSAFLVPLEDQTSDQRGFMSEDYLAKSMIATRRVQIPHRWSQESRGPGGGRYIPTMRLLVVERKPVTREWTEGSGTGTSSKNQGIMAESQESIGFIARMNCVAQIDQGDAVRFLFRYNLKPLEEVMDAEIRARVESKFVETCARMPLAELICKKDQIMRAVREDVIPYFKERGITITVLGLKGDITYVDPEIQKSINLKFTAAQELEAQKSLNEKVLSKARADAEADTLAAKARSDALRAQMLDPTRMAYHLRLLELENQRRAIDRWQGSLPSAMSATTSVFGLPLQAAAK